MVNRAYSVPITRYVLFPVFLILFFFQLWFLWKSLVGYLLQDVLRYALLGLTVWQFPFCPFFLSGRNPILPTWKSPVAILFFIFLCSGFPRRFLLVPWEVTDYFFFFCWVFWLLWLLLCFLFSFLVLFFRVVLIFFWLCTWKDPRLLMVAEDPGYLISCRGFLFLLHVSSFGLQASWAFFLSWSPCTYFFGLGLFFFWVWLTLLGFSHCDPFRPQHLAPRARGLPEAHAWVIQVF